MGLDYDECDSREKRMTIPLHHQFSGRFSSLGSLRLRLLFLRQVRICVSSKQQQQCRFQNAVKNSEECKYALNQQLENNESNQHTALRELSSFSEEIDSWLTTDALFVSLTEEAAAAAAAPVLFERGGETWTTFSLLRVCRTEAFRGRELLLVVVRLCLNRQAPHSLLLLPLSFCCSSAVVSLELDITGVVLGVG